MDEQLHLKDLTADPTNRRRRTERSAAMLERSLEQCGASRSIVIDETNTVLCGNGVLDAAASMGIESVRVVDSTGNELVAVRRMNLTPEQKRAIALYDNRTAELSVWVPEQLQQDVSNGLDLTAWFTPKELQHVLKTTPTEMATTPTTLTKAACVCPSCGHEFVPA